VLYYITPQVWAWRSGRLETLARTVTKAAVILPFEQTLLQKHGVDATFVGHPLLDHVGALPSRLEARARLQLDPGAHVLALFPGSRRQEIAHHAEAFVGAAQELQRRQPSLEVVVAAAPHVTIDPGLWPFRIVQSESFTLLRAADAAMCKSGTTTLEAAVAGCPFVIAYRTGRLNYEIARRVIRISNIGLVNLVAGHKLVPEFVQDALEPRAVADALEPLLDRESPVRSRMVDGLAEVRAALGESGAAGRVASMVLDLAGGRRR
jgi:lipid-A-disaccharide synthase